MVSIVKTAALTVAVLTAVANAATCTTKQYKDMATLKPDTPACVKYWSEDVTPPSKETLCKDTTCKASMRRMIEDFPDCTTDEGLNFKDILGKDLDLCDATAPRCTSAEVKALNDATPDKAICTKYYSYEASPPLSVFCKDAVCIASVERLIESLPDCSLDGVYPKQSLTNRVETCKTAAGGDGGLEPDTPVTMTPKPTTKTPKPTTKAPKPTTQEPIANDVTDVASDDDTMAPSPARTQRPTTRAPAPVMSAASVPSHASTLLLGSSLVAVVYMAAN